MQPLHCRSRVSWKSGLQVGARSSTSLRCSKGHVVHCHGSHPFKFLTTFHHWSEHPWGRLGGVLTQQHWPHCIFEPNTLRRHNRQFVVRNKSIYERELMVFAFVVCKWQHYLLFQSFIICTNQCNLKYLLEQIEVQKEYHRLLFKFLGYQLTIQYKEGKYNKVTDALSCLLK